MTTWLVAYDFSDAARAALRFACDQLSKQGGGRVVVAHSHAQGPGDGEAIVDAAAEALAAAYIADAELQLLEDVRAVSAPGVAVEGRIIGGQAANAIAMCARDLKVDLIAVGSHGRRGLQRILLGSVAESIIRQVSCPVVVVKRS